MLFMLKGIRVVEAWWLVLCGEDRKSLFDAFGCEPSLIILFAEVRNPATYQSTSEPDALDFLLLVLEQWVVCVSRALRGTLGRNILLQPRGYGWVCFKPPKADACLKCHVVSSGLERTVLVLLFGLFF